MKKEMVGFTAWIASMTALFLFGSGCSTPTEQLTSAIRINNKTAIQQALKDIHARNFVLREAVANKDLVTVERILANLKEEELRNEVFALPTDLFLEYDAAYTIAQNDGFTYLMVTTLPTTDMLHAAILNRDEDMARLLLKYGAKTGHTYYMDRSGLGSGFMTKAEMLHPSVGEVSWVSPDGTATVLRKKEGRIKSQTERKAGTQYAAVTHAEIARQVGLSSLAAEIESNP
jgi:hypothetical protein